MSFKAFIVGLLLSFPLCSLAGPIAVITVQHPEVKTSHSRKLERSIYQRLKREKGVKLVPPAETKEGVRSELTALLENELKEAWSQYYFLELEGAEKTLKGREDLEALLLLALIASSRGEKKSQEDVFVRLLRLDPGLQLDPKQFPPKIVRFYEELKEEVKKKTGGKVEIPLKKMPKKHILGRNFYLREVVVDRWDARIKELMKQKGWEEVLLVGIEPIGWNHKVFGHLFTQKQKKGLNHFRVEVKHLSAVPEAGKILVEKLILLP